MWSACHTAAVARRADQFIVVYSAPRGVNGGMVNHADVFFRLQTKEKRAGRESDVGPKNSITLR